MSPRLSLLAFYLQCSFLYTGNAGKFLKMERVENIFNRPPAVSEDTVQYVLYPPKEQSDKASVTTLAVLMQNHTDSLLPDMQWHRDGFQLKVVPHPLGRGFILEGRMRVGDAIDDEWCAVWLLREITTKWDVAVRCVTTLASVLRF